MRKKLIVANWKSNKNNQEATEWLNNLALCTRNLVLNTNDFEVVICPPYIDLPALYEKLKIVYPVGENLKFKISLGAQDVSPFPDGSYTGAISATQLSGLVNYCLVGHSERRKYFEETNESVAKKVDLLLGCGIKPIICAQDISEIPKNLKSYPTDQIIIMFEPAKAISQNGVYQAENPQEVKKTLASWQQTLGPYQMLYGGSVNPDNAKRLLLAGAEGFVIGHASLSVDSFISILQNV